MKKKNSKTEDKIGNAEKYLQEIGKKLDKFFNKTKNKDSELKKKLKQNIEDLQNGVIKAKNEISNSARWQEIEGDIKKASYELEEAVKKALKKKPSKKD